MAKQLSDSANVHALTGSTRVRSVSPAEKGEAYNLVVADFSTYFVGAAGLLAHDVTPHRPTQSAMPGCPKQTPTDADVALQH